VGFPHQETLELVIQELSHAYIPLEEAVVQAAVSYRIKKDILPGCPFNGRICEFISSFSGSISE